MSAVARAIWNKTRDVDCVAVAVLIGGANAGAVGVVGRVASRAGRAVIRCIVPGLTLAAGRPAPLIAAAAAAPAVGVACGVVRVPRAVQRHRTLPVATRVVVVPRCAHRAVRSLVGHEVNRAYTTIGEAPLIPACAEAIRFRPRKGNRMVVAVGRRAQRCARGVVAEPLGAGTAVQRRIVICPARAAVAP